MDEHIEEIAIRAHRIYEAEGQPEGKADEHWHRAERELREELDRAPAEPQAGS